MACFNGLVLFFIYCFSSDVVELEPVNASPAITCSAITSSNGGQAACDGLPGCTWWMDNSTCGPDPCLKFGDSQVTQPSGLTITCICPSDHLSVQPGAVCEPPSWTPGYPAQGSGGGKDFYCKRQITKEKTNDMALDQCSYQYLKNGSCVGPYCILQDYAAAPAGGKICKKLTACIVQKMPTNPTNGIRLQNNQAIASCLTARVAAGDSTACNQNPRFYLSGSSCVEDPLYAPVSDQDNPSCDPPAVLKQVKGVNTNAVVTLSYCASPNNPVLNTCWNLVNQTYSGTPPSGGCPTNPHSESTLYSENTGLCTGDCFTQTISSYYYGYTKICVNAESALDSSKILAVPSLLALLLLAFFL